MKRMPRTAAQKSKQEALAKVRLKPADIASGLREMGEEDYDGWKAGVKARCGDAQMPTQIRCVCVHLGTATITWNVA